ncbi:MAG: RNA polymerase sigma factor [Anaerostipes sp.]|jgi:RNA polymerase sigma-70 factor (ECF subfamily)
MKKEEFCSYIKQYQIDFFRFAFSMTKNTQDAEDAVSESILKAYEKLDTLRFKSKFKSWFFQILRNECLKIIKQKNKQGLTYDGIVPEQVVPDDKMECDEDLSLYLLNIKEEYREVLILYYYEEFSVSEISKILKIPNGTVKSRLSRGRSKIKNLLKLNGRCSYENG